LVEELANRGLDGLLIYSRCCGNCVSNQV